MTKERNWDQRYSEDNIPWDNGQPCEQLTSWFERTRGPFRRALVVGCGTGVNAIWLARQGLEVTATDISPVAIERAKRRADEAGVDVRFLVHDIQQDEPFQQQSIDLAFDRGVYHVFDPDGRRRFAERISAALVPHGHWLSLAGNADEPGKEGQGPPRLTAGEVITPAEPLFALNSIRPVRFAARFGPLLFWEAHWQLRQRPSPGGD